MRPLAALLVFTAACDPFWGARVTLHDQANRPVETATVAVACDEGSAHPVTGMAVLSDNAGNAQVGGLGSQFPVGCDLFIAKPGYTTQRIRYRDLCPQGPRGCERVFDFALVLEPESGWYDSSP